MLLNGVGKLPLKGLEYIDGTTHHEHFCAASWALNPKIAVGKLRVGKAHFG